MKLTARSYAATLALGKKIAARCRPGDVIALYGELGAGKTALTKGIAAGLGIDQRAVISPTFVFIRQHQGRKLPLYHFDLYRCDSCAQIAGLGYEEFIEGDGVAVIEWAERLGALLPREHLAIHIGIASARQRTYSLQAHGSRYDRFVR